MHRKRRGSGARVVFSTFLKSLFLPFILTLHLTFLDLLLCSVVSAERRWSSQLCSVTVGLNTDWNWKLVFSNCISEMESYIE